MPSRINQRLNQDIPSNILLSTERQSPCFHRINIEYFILLYGIDQNLVNKAIFKGLVNNLVGSNSELRIKADQWKTEHKKILEHLASNMAFEIKRQQKHLPVSALRRLPINIEAMQAVLLKTPNSYHAHFHLGWLYSIRQDYKLSERHFNIAAMQSQVENPQFACFAYRHLSSIRLKNKQAHQSLLAIEAACTLNRANHSELEFERIQLLSYLNKTTQALPQLAQLIKSAPHYVVYAAQDAVINGNPSLSRFFDNEKAKHIKNIRAQLQRYWSNDPLHLLNLDKELGQKNSQRLLQKKQLELLQKLSPVMIFHGEISSKLIQQRSHQIVLKSLNTKKQQFVEGIEKQQRCASKVHSAGQWMLYSAIIALISLGLSYAVSAFAFQFNFHLPVNHYVQSILIACTVILVIVGVVLLHFTPSKLTDLLRRKQRLEAIALRLGHST